MKQYKQIPEPYYTKWLNLCEESYQYELKGNYIKAIKITEKAFNIIPEPRIGYGDAYNTIEDLIKLNLEIQNFSRAIELVEKIEEYHLFPNEYGDIEALKGKVYFEAGQLEKSYDHFKEAVNRDTLRVITPESKEDKEYKYLDFYKNPKKYIE